MKIRPLPRTMRIPEPDYLEDSTVFYPLVKVGPYEPFGYRENPDDPQILIPVERELLLLDQAKVHIKNRHSYRAVANWLSEKSGRKISHQGLKDRIALDISRGKEYTNAKHLVKQLIWAYRKAKSLEASRLGQREPLKSTIDQDILEIVSKAAED